MKTKSFLKQLDNSDYILISEDQLKELINSSKIIFKEDTLISDSIRIFEFVDYYIFQEKSPKSEIILRKFNDKADANHLVQKRLDIYEKMWNGCGCRIDYYSI